MPSINELLDENPPDTAMHAALAVGAATLGQQQTVDFVPYVRTVLPLDGFVFWLNAALLSPEQFAVHNLQSADPVSVDGSLHYASVGHQVEDETIAVRRVDFTAMEQITAFAEIAPDVMYVATWNAPLGSFQFTFSQRGTYYQQANVHHYVGDAIYPVFAAQLIDNLGDFDQRQVVSNSLPLWLAAMSDVPPGLQVTFSLPLYPAHLVPPNLVPPYGVVDITPSSTRPLQAQAFRDGQNSRSQLCAESVRVVLYGLRNDDVMDFIDYIVDRCALVGDFGIMNSPVVRDDRRAQVELAALAMRKMVDFEINYNQARSREIAQQLISQIVPTYLLSDSVVPPQLGADINPDMVPYNPIDPDLSPANLVLTESGEAALTETGSDVLLE